MRILANILFLGLVIVTNCFADVRSSIYRIVAENCGTDGAERFLTGFVPDGETIILTALHGVAGCSNIKAIRASSSRTVIKDLYISALNFDKDVAALSTLQYLPVGTIKRAQDDLDSTELHSVIGFPQGVPGVHEIPAMIQNPALIALRKRIPPGGGAKKLLRRGSPSIDLEIIDVHGDLQIGHSGAPLLNSNQQLVGIVNGGVGNGEYGIGWAIPVRGLKLNRVDPQSTRLENLIEHLNENPHNSQFTSGTNNSAPQNSTISFSYAAGLFAMGWMGVGINPTTNCTSVETTSEVVNGEEELTMLNEIAIGIRNEAPLSVYRELTRIIDSSSMDREDLNRLANVVSSAEEFELIELGYGFGRRQFLEGMRKYLTDQVNELTFSERDELALNEVASCFSTEFIVNQSILSGIAERLGWKEVSSSIRNGSIEGRLSEKLLNTIKDAISRNYDR